MIATVFLASLVHHMSKKLFLIHPIKHVTTQCPHLTVGHTEADRVNSLPQSSNSIKTHNLQHNVHSFCMFLILPVYSNKRCLYMTAWDSSL